MHQTGYGAPTILARRGADCSRQWLVHFRALAFGLPRAQHPVAAFFFRLDVRWGCGALGSGHSRWVISSGLSRLPFGLHQSIRNFFGRTPLDVSSISRGQLQRLDRSLRCPDGCGNFLVIVGSIWGYLQLPDKRRSDLGRLALAFVLTTDSSPLPSLSASRATCPVSCDVASAWSLISRNHEAKGPKKVEN